MISYLLRTIRLGFKSLLLHKLRSGLAMLGILIGVTAVIWLVALGEGVSYQAQQQIKDLGATNVIIKSVKPSQTSSSSSNQSMIVDYGLTRNDFMRIMESVPSIRRAVPMREMATTAWVGGRSAETSADPKETGVKLMVANLPQGKTTLKAWYAEANGKDLCGAFFVTVGRKK